MTATEIRKRIIDVTMKNGGHLASSLGAVEIAMALRQVFDPERDRVLWDVGHQSYAWKLLTGRDTRFDTLRQLDGVSPFANPLESNADAAVSGHAGSAFSVAVGLAAARDRLKADYEVVAVVGDASMANGHSFEALNNCAAATKKVILVLNDNEMSISRPVGALAKMLGRLISSVGYNRIKIAAETAGHRMGLTFLREAYHRLESRVKGLILGNRFFEQFGLRYIGPIDGHDLAALVEAFTVAKHDKRSVIVHVVTKKGKGYEPAEQDPTKYHGVSPQAGRAVSMKPPQDWSSIFGSLMIDAARKDSRVVALTAGMKDGTGLNDFAAEFPERFFDVGIAEGHMLSFAAGLAAAGMRPVIAVYSTFLQRAFDQVMHDIAIAKLPVVICVDRAGIVGADGMTHQGLYDFAALKCLPNLTIAQPCNSTEFKTLFEEALNRKGPTIIRYPRGAASEVAVPLANSDARVQIWATGDYLARAIEVAEKTGAGVVYARILKPFDKELLASQRAQGKKIVSLENGAVVGGFGESIGADLRFGWPDEFIPHGSVEAIERRYGLDVESLAAKINEVINNG